MTVSPTATGGQLIDSLSCDGGPLANSAHDPRWGRISETYGEDPCVPTLTPPPTHPLPPHPHPTTHTQTHTPTHPHPPAHPRKADTHCLPSGSNSGAQPWCQPGLLVRVASAARRCWNRRTALL